MKPPKPLLHDVVHDESYESFRSELREAALGQLRHTRRTRRAIRVLAAAACVAAAFVGHLFVQRSAVVPSGVSGVSVVRSSPLRAGQLVRTGDGGSVVHGGQPTTEAALELSVVRTRLAPADVLTDQELLDLFRDDTASLITWNDGRKQLQINGVGV